ncbi:MAG: hypothetical protein AAGE03_04335 [Pseudomonadota bacterium]
MTSAKALHPVKADGKWVKPGGDLDAAKIGKTRLERLVAKGRAEAAPVNRADGEAGRPDLSSRGKK